ncbi:hypothetical protein E3N88_11958 [Mikania micrantha]|uniref:DUF4216 domain-containing protein n=1 Tax=Mikania micrantha TaxID=192012 RepID=A0A5N6P498_9ASTR|nr:hypothetical protein E3N88_11958 [Mikania micrantha]
MGDNSKFSGENRAQNGVRMLPESRNEDKTKIWPPWTRAGTFLQVWIIFLPAELRLNRNLSSEIINNINYLMTIKAMSLTLNVQKDSISVVSKFERRGRNCDKTSNDARNFALDVFTFNGRRIGANEYYNLPMVLMKKATWFIFNNCQEVKPFLEHLWDIPENNNVEDLLEDVNLLREDIAEEIVENVDVHGSNGYIDDFFDDEIDNSDHSMEDFDLELNLDDLDKETPTNDIENVNSDDDDYW